ncbi:hypothetical protein HW130_03195 [Streptomyces sp. PKU-EA00015]|uniref:hypothetical protein n=1 Tax=Streptomyces sp. PKU-EA00015 TaxID=2748326 RepID=UPI0015A2815D|nr:hypothetical protein [Streptomyces sp. PKU-EA00015]NWF25278.1 hypothetical protein [Streptomyces sp. PKU-EA00015]
MATWTWRTVTSTRREWEVPAAEPWGAFLGDIRGALLAASIAYREAHGLPEDAPLTDDALRFKVTDDAILISFTTETPAP